MRLLRLLRRRGRSCEVAYHGSHVKEGNDRLLTNDNSRHSAMKILLRQLLSSIVFYTQSYAWLKGSKKCYLWYIVIQAEQAEHIPTPLVLHNYLLTTSNESPVTVALHSNQK